MIHAAIAVVQPGDVLALAEAADQRLGREERTRARLKGGELGLDIYGLRNVLTERGVVWRD